MGKSEKEARYGQRETQMVLKRAAQLQHQSEVDPGALTLAELEQLGQEVGLDPRHVRQAAQQLAYERTTAPRPFLGAPTSILLERTLPGELPAQAFEALAAEIQRTLSPGQSSLIGRTLTWTAFPVTARGGGRSLVITISAASGETRVRVEEKLGNLAGGYFGGLMGGVGGAVGGMAIPIGILVHSMAAIFGIFGAAVLGSYAAARALYRAAVRRRSSELQALFDRLCEGAEAAIAAGATGA